MPVESILAWAEAHLNEALTDLEQLVNIDSPPDFKRGLDTVGSIMSDHLSRLGFKVEKVERESYGDQIVARNQNKDKPRVLILGHLDTVHPVGTAAKRPFKVEGNLARGPGVADDRSGLVGLIYALRALAESRLLESLPSIVIVLATDEEANSTSSREVILREARNSDIVLSVEPGRPEGLVTSRSGAGQYYIAVEGIEAHAGTNPQDGANAIVELAFRSCALHELTDLKRGDVVNVGRIGGGRWINLVAGSAWAEVQTHFKTAGDRLEEAVRRVLEAAPTIPGTKVTWKGGITHPAWEQNEKSESLKRFIQGIGEELGLDLSKSIGGGAADCNLIAPLALPMVDSMAPVGGNLHSEEEYLLVDTIPGRVALLAMTLARIREYRVD
ncbi:MAG TPA: M20 family metallopeptidase [Firmicutes bacterium]|nr:M20 family metallopeptidase [Bacillota bacterium]